MYKRFDQGKVDADTFIKQVETEVGIKPTPEFINYIRTEKVGQALYNKVAHALNYNQDLKKNSAYVDPVKPYDQDFHRAKRNKLPGPAGSSHNAFQEDVGKTLQNYTSGNVNGKHLRQKLAEYNVTIDPQIDKLIRKHESGDFVNYNEIGKLVYRQLNGTDLYNRVDKINLNNPKIVSPEKTGRKPFTQTETCKESTSRQTDDLAIETQHRHLGAKYLPKKGQIKEAKPGVYQLESNMEKVIKAEMVKGYSTVSDRDFDNLSTLSAR